MPDTVVLEWPHGRLEVALLAGMLVDLCFDLVEGGFRPLAPRQWEDPGPVGLPGHLRVLGGDFVCVPFGSAGSANVPGWSPLPADDPPHGHGADAEWTVERIGPSEMVLSCHYPEDSPVARLRRRLRVQGCEVESTLTVHVRRACSLPIGLHPVLRLPEDDRLLLEAHFAAGFTYPAPVHASSRTAVGAHFTTLRAVPGLHGDMLDLHRLPPGSPTEDVLLLTGMRPPVRAHFDDAQIDLLIDWDASVLPSMLVWLSDRALQEPPWEGRYRGLGLEPVAAAFDLPLELSAQPNPLTQAGVVTAVHLTPTTPLTIVSSIRAERAHADAHAPKDR